MVRTVTETATVRLTVMPNSRQVELFSLANRIACMKEAWQRVGKPEISAVKSSFVLTHEHGEPVAKEKVE